MKLENMKFIKLNRDKTPKEKLDKCYDYSSITFCNDLGVLIQEPFVVFDVDDKVQFLKLKQIIEDKKIKCNIMKTTRGGHFWFKSLNTIKNNIKIKTPIGIEIDIRSWGKLCYTKIKQDGKLREWLTEYDFNELDDIPFWLQPIKHSYDLINLKNGDGRNDKLYSYIIVLNNYMTKEKVGECYQIINDYILGDKLKQSELETILRDESFDNLRPNFFDKSKFLFDKFAKWLCNNHSILRQGRMLYLYNNSFYTNNVDDILSLMLKYIPSLNRNQRNEVLDYLRLQAPIVPETPYYFVATKNCILDVINNTRYEYSSDFFIPNILNVIYNPKIKKCDEIDKFMNWLTCNDKELENLIYEMIGYCLIPTSKYQKSFILYGIGSNGKSTLLNLISDILGDDNISSLSIKEINSNFKLAEITNKLANIGDDISDEYITDSSIFKKLVSGEEITVERKHEQPYKIRNYSTLIFATNNLPNMQDKSNGMTRRLCIIPFNAVINDADPNYDPFILDRITSDDAKSYVLNKALEGLNRLFVNNRFTTPNSVVLTKEKYLYDTDIVMQFIDEFGKENIYNKDTKTVLEEYKLFCENNSHIKNSATYLNKGIKRILGYEKLKHSKKKGKRAMTSYYYGIEKSKMMQM